MHRALLLALVLGCDAAPAVIDPGTTAPDASHGGTCEPGTQLCNGKKLLLCRADGAGFTTIECDLGCAKGACLTSSCTPGSRRCAGPKLAEDCDAAGQPAQTVCDHGCLDGECVPIACTAGLRFCDDAEAKVQQCSVDGLQVTEVESCPFDCDAATATCKPPACEPGEVRCNEDAVERCAADRKAFEFTGISCPLGCKAGSCLVTACQPGEERCGGNGVETCDIAGSAFEPTKGCTWGCLQSGEGKALCAECPPGASACYGQDILHCDSPFEPWQVALTCDALDTCAGAMCVKVLTLPGPAASAKPRILLVKALADCVVSGEGKEKTRDACRGLDTTALDIDLAKVDLLAWFCTALEEESIDAKDFGDDAHFAVAKDLMGCGWLNTVEIGFETKGEKVHAGLVKVECVGYDGTDGVIAPCDTFK